MVRGFCCVFPGSLHVTLLSACFRLSISTCPLHQHPSGRSRSHCAMWVSRAFDNYLSTQLLLSECQETHTDDHISVARIFYISVMPDWMESCPISLEETDFYQRKKKHLQKSSTVEAAESYMFLSGVNFGQVPSLF